MGDAGSFSKGGSQQRADVAKDVHPQVGSPSSASAERARAAVQIRRSLAAMSARSEGRAGGHDAASPAAGADGEKIHLADKDPTKRKLRIRATGPALANFADLFDRKAADDIDAAQETLNDLYRAKAKEGDGSCAFGALQSATEKGDPTGADHYNKSKQYSKALGDKANLAKLPATAKEVLLAEKAKLDEAVAWADANKGKKKGTRSQVPRWARPWRDQLE